ncbi:MAG: lysophospholipid acyltransferase family protein [Desulfobulbaceae bacterium]|nr:lysophospholipid acyltransferase family protein [Desulfobulbaceae bacterium]
MTKQWTLKKRLEAIGHGFFYLTMHFLGQLGAYVLLVPVVTVYVLFGRGIHRATAPYLSRRFPAHGRVDRWFDTLRNIISFGQVLVDRGWLGMKAGSLEGEFDGYDRLLDLIKQGKGVVLLTAHVGNWQSALAKLDNLPARVHALMKYDQAAVAKHYFDLDERRSGPPFEIINIDGPFGGMIEATAALQRGEVVTIMGDRLTKGSSVTVDFLGSPMRFPDTAYALASMVDAPVVVVLAAKTGRKTYKLRIWDVFTPGFEDRSKRGEMLTAHAKKFAEILEKYLRQYPYQWYNFFDFWRQ